MAQNRQYSQLQWKFVGAVGIGYYDQNGNLVTSMTYFYDAIFRFVDSSGVERTSKLSYETNNASFSRTKPFHIQGPNTSNRWTFWPLADGTMGVVYETSLTSFTQRCFRKQADAAAFAALLGGK